MKGGEKNKAGGKEAGEQKPGKQKRGARHGFSLSMGIIRLEKREWHLWARLISYQNWITLRGCAMSYEQEKTQYLLGFSLLLLFW
jgi:hypothetical protein